MSPAAAETITDVRTALLQWQPRIQRDARHRYTCDGKRLAGTTTINGACGLGKEGLIYWAANEELMAAAEVARRILNSSGRDISDGAIRLALADRAFYCPKCELSFAKPSTCGPCGKQTLTAFELFFKKAAGAQRAHQKQLKDAGDLGTDVHALIEWFLRGRMGEKAPRPSVKEEAEFVYAGFEEWAKAADLRPLLLEFYVVNPAHGYGGTVDLLAFVEGHLDVVDWKSGKKGRVYAEHLMQNIAYRKAVQAMTGGELPGGLLVTLPRDGGAITPHPVKDNPEELWAAFQACKTLHAWGGGSSK